MKKFGLLVPLDAPDPEDGEEVDAADLVERFVVPALLPAAPPGFRQNRSEWGDKHSTPCTCYVIFTLTEMHKESSIHIDEMKTDGFLPSGLFERVLGGCISWSQAASRNGFIRLEELAMYSDGAVLDFGSQTFRILPLPELNCLRIDVEGSNPLPVISRVLKITEGVINDCMKSLHAFIALPWQDKSNPSTESFEDSDSKAAMLLPLENLRKAVEKKKSLKKRGLDLLTYEELITDYRQWMNIYVDRASYDIFLSYRWATFDSLITEQVFDATSNFVLGQKQRRIEVFQDIKRLQKGEAFDSAFAKALINSTVVVPLMSANALTNMTKQDGTWCDNVLLEWMIAAECMKAKGNGTLVKACYPIFIGNISESTDDTDVVIGDFFASGILKKLPDCTPTETIKRAKKLLSENNMTPSPALDTYTVASFINEFNLLQLGFKVDCKARKLPSRIAKDAHEILTHHFVDDHAAESLAAASHKAVAAAAQGRKTPLDTLYELLMDKRKSKEQFPALQEYLREDLCVTSADDLEEFIKVDKTMCKIKEFLTEDGGDLFEVKLNELLSA